MMKAGFIIVSLTIEITSPDLCIDMVSKEVMVGNNYCQAFFTYKKSDPPGTICFSNDSQWQGDIESWSWDFGDGSEGSNEENPCHVYDCGSIITISLTLLTTDGWTSSYSFADLIIDFFLLLYQTSENRR